MPSYLASRCASLAWALALVCCTSDTSPGVRLGIQPPADFTARVISTDHQQGWAPGGFWMDQYAVQVAVAPSDTATGLVISARAPAYLQASSALMRDSVADIRPGDSIQVWQTLDRLVVQVLIAR